MPGIHLDQMLRYCGAITQVTGQSSFFVNGLKAAVEGDRDTHNNGGSLISTSEGSIFIEGKKMIVSMIDRGMPDSIGMIIHPFCPTAPAQGATNFMAYGGKAGGGLGSILSGNLNIGELVSIGSQVIGTVKNFTNNGNGTGNVVLQNLQAAPQAGQTLVGQESGHSFTLTSFERSNIYDGDDTGPGTHFTQVLNDAIVDDYGIIAMPEYFTGLPSQDYQTEYIVVNDG